VGTYHDPVRNPTSSQSSFGGTHQWSDPDEPFNLHVGGHQSLGADDGETKIVEVQHIWFFSSSPGLLEDSGIQFSGRIMKVMLDIEDLKA